MTFKLNAFDHFRSKVVDNIGKGLSLVWDSGEEDSDPEKNIQDEDYCWIKCYANENSCLLPGEKWLHEAARTNNMEKLGQLIDQKVNVNAKNNTDKTALHFAAAHGHVAAIEKLLKAGADLEAKDKYGNTALLWAALFGRTEAVRMLVNAGSNSFHKNRKGMNFLHCAASQNHVAIIQFIQDTMDSFQINQTDLNQQTALMLAAQQGHVETGDKLLDMKCEVNKKDASGQTAVHLAAASGHHEFLRKLLLFGVELDDRDMEGRTALHLASENGCHMAASVLLSHNADVNALTTKDLAPLHLAAHRGECDVLQTLLEHHAKIDAQDCNGNTALHLAAQNDQTAALRLLMDSNAALDIINKRGRTALHEAVELGKADAVEELLLAGANIEAKEKTGKTPIHMAARGSYIGIVDMIIKAERYRQTTFKEPVTSHRSRTDHDLQFRRPDHPCTDQMKELLWILATKQLRQGEWRRLALHWGFTENHIRAIEHQYTGPQSHRDHGYRLLLIWLHGVKKDEPPVKHLYEALSAIGRKDLGENIRKKVNSGAPLSSNSSCLVS